jgi:uncharacterized protein YwqG
MEGKMDKLEQARQIIRELTLSDDLKKLGEEDIGSYADDDTRFYYFDGMGSRCHNDELTSDVLAKSLHYIIDIRYDEWGEQKQVEKGKSKIKGIPDLPEGFKWTKGYYFHAQINLSELATINTLNNLPQSGMLYFFFNPYDGEGMVHYFDVGLDELNKNYPDVEFMGGDERTYENFRSKEYEIKFEPKLKFKINDHEEEIPEMLPKAVINDLEQYFNTPLKSSNDVFAFMGPEIDTCNMFGQPWYCQGEDELDADEECTDNNILLFQDTHGEANIHYQIDRNELNKGNFSEAFLTFSH